MSYIARDDGAHFVIPSYRDVLAGKQKGLLKRDILLLSQNYGEYVALRPKGKGGLQYEVAFSTEPGYLLGESVWDYFKRPEDLIYCEVIPNTTEAILVIVKSGSVYLDGSFPIESIPEELVIFLTQQNHFEIYVYGDVPISAAPEHGKFSFDAASVKSFTVLEEPVFPLLPLLKPYQLQLVDAALRAQGIGVFPVKKAIIVAALIGLGFFFWTYMSGGPKVAPTKPKVNPYQGYLAALASPSPNEELQAVVDQIGLLGTMPGWTAKTYSYTAQKASVGVVSGGSPAEALFQWARANGIAVSIQKNGFSLTMVPRLKKRAQFMNIYPIQEVIGQFIDKLAKVYPGNRLTMTEIKSKGGVYANALITINLKDASPVLLTLIGKQLEGLPIVLQSITLNFKDGNISGNIILQILGN